MSSWKLGDNGELVEQEARDNVVKSSEARSKPIQDFFAQQKTLLSIDQPEDENIQFKSIKAIIQDPLVSSKHDVLNIGSPLEIDDNKPLLELSPLHQNIEDEATGIVPGLEHSTKVKKNKVVQLNNFYIGTNILNDELVELIKDRNIKKVLILSDTGHTRNMSIYRIIASKLNDLSVPFVEFTNIQPKVTRDMLFKMADFAFLHNVNAVFVVGSDSTIDVSKLLLAKLLKPNLIRLHKNQSKPIISTNFTIASFPTVVVPDKKVNSCSLLDNSIFFKKFAYMGDTIFLSHPIDNADAVFYYVPLFEELSQEKIIELLHETYFRLIFNYFDARATAKEQEKLIHDIKTIVWYLDNVLDNKKLTDLDIKVIMHIIAYTVNGVHFIDHGFYWTWYKLEASLSKMVNSKKSDGLALFLPSFLEYAMLEESSNLKNAIVSLGIGLFNSSTADGCIYNLIKHIEKYKLPTKILDIPQIKKIDYKFLFYLIRKSTNYVGSYRAIRTIVKNLAVW